MWFKVVLLTICCVVVGNAFPGVVYGGSRTGTLTVDPATVYKATFSGEKTTECLPQDPNAPIAGGLKKDQFSLASVTFGKKISDLNKRIRRATISERLKLKKKVKQFKKNLANRLLACKRFYPPTLSLLSLYSAEDDEELRFEVSASDFSGETLSFSVSDLPTGASFDSNTRTFVWTSSPDESGTYDITFTVSNGYAAKSQKTTLSRIKRSRKATPTATSTPTPSPTSTPTPTPTQTSTPTPSPTPTPANRAPVLSFVADKTTVEGSLLAFTLSASDADGDSLTYSAAGLPSGATLNPATGAFSWTPDYSQIGSYSVTFKVSDGKVESTTPGLINVTNKPSKFGVLAPTSDRDDGPGFAQDLGVQWIRLGAPADGSSPNFQQYLDTGMNLIVNINYRKGSNIDQVTWGDKNFWYAAGFPYVDRDQYIRDVQATIQPVLPYLDQGRQIWVQCENEAGDNTYLIDDPNKATLGSKYWRGTNDQYLLQINALAEAVRALDPRIKVVLTSFTSESLSIVIRSKYAEFTEEQYNYHVDRITKLLVGDPLHPAADYDAVDLHLYGCAVDIAAKAQWVKDNMPVKKPWITTEVAGPNPHSYPDVNCPRYVSYDEDSVTYQNQQTSELTTRFDLVKANGGEFALWFSLFDAGGEDDVFKHLGILTNDDPAVKKPVYDTFKAYPK